MSVHADSLVQCRSTGGWLLIGWLSSSLSWGWWSDICMQCTASPSWCQRQVSFDMVMMMMTMMSIITNASLREGESQHTHNLQCNAQSRETCSEFGFWKSPSGPRSYHHHHHLHHLHHHHHHCDLCFGFWKPPPGPWFDLIRSDLISSGYKMTHWHKTEREGEIEGNWDFHKTSRHRQKKLWPYTDCNYRQIKQGDKWHKTQLTILTGWDNIERDNMTEHGSCKMRL